MSEKGERRHVRKGIKVSICIRCERQVNVTPATNWRSVLHKQEPPNCQDTSKARKLQWRGAGEGERQQGELWLGLG